MSSQEIKLYAKDVPKWQVASDEKKVTRVFTLKDFKEAIIFVNKVADLAEKEGHHPDMTIHFNKVTVELWTHNAGGLFINDFIVAAKVDKIS